MAVAVVVFVAMAGTLGGGIDSIATVVSLPIRVAVTGAAAIFVAVPRAFLGDDFVATRSALPTRVAVAGAIAILVAVAGALFADAPFVDVAVAVVVDVVTRIVGRSRVNRLVVVLAVATRLGAVDAGIVPIVVGVDGFALVVLHGEPVLADTLAVLADLGVVTHLVLV